MTDKAHFSLQDGNLRIWQDDLRGEWTGRPDGLAVIDFQVGADRAWAIALLDPPSGSGSVQNLVKIGAGLKIIWHAELPRGGLNDCFTGFGLLSDRLIYATTWSGYRVQISADSGRIVDVVFSK